MKKVLLILVMVFSAYLVNAQIVINTPVTVKGKVLTGVTYKATDLSFNVQTGIGSVPLYCFLDEDASSDFNNAVDMVYVSYQTASIPNCEFINDVIVENLAKKYDIIKDNINSSFCPE